ncbi:hypothetical protein [Bartonella bovis]|uniref:Right handed beta helix domain-containing protein n=1 Tax=Bartonella bovis 91-4 TaxID=1094491 RepID=N6VNV3_9HYPH|nr:hypothetical protein [Bartonella bovis]ENN92712.1 hypothetical protein BBbe_01870 [Bartonella bovis 91-4]
MKVGREVTATLTNVTIEGTGSGTSGSGEGSKGVIKEGTEMMMMMNMVTIEGVKKGKVDINMGTIGFESGNGNWGVKVENGATANIMGATITGSGNGEGTGLYVVGGTATMNGGEISEVSEGVLMKGGGTLTMNNGSIGFKDGAENFGIGVGKLVTNARLTDLTITGASGQGKGKGVIMESMGKMTMTNVGISGVQTGIQVSNGNLTVNGGEIKEVQTGISMLGSGKLVVNNGARITFKGDHGVKVGGTVNATITGAEIKGVGRER